MIITEDELATTATDHEEERPRIRDPGKLRHEVWDTSVTLVTIWTAAPRAIDQLPTAVRKSMKCATRRAETFADSFEFCRADRGLAIDGLDGHS